MTRHTFTPEEQSRGGTIRCQQQSMTLQEALKMNDRAIRCINGTWTQVLRTNNGFDIDRGCVGQAESYYHQETPEFSHVFDYVQEDCTDWRVDREAFEYAHT